jgi:hypothetical protein
VRNFCSKGIECDESCQFCPAASLQVCMMMAPSRIFASISPQHGLAVLLTVFCCHPVLGQLMKAEDSGPNVRLTLSRQTVWQGAYGWCTFSAETFADSGGISYRCGGGGPFGTASPGSNAGDIRQRPLSGSERATLRQLYQAARLFDGGHIGADFSASDLPFEMLIVRPTGGSKSRAAVVLVTWGNATFASGPRKALIDWLRSIEAALTKD